MSAVLCVCGHAIARHDRVSYKDGQAPDYPCLDPGCDCANLWPDDVAVIAVWLDWEDD